MEGVVWIAAQDGKKCDKPVGADTAGCESKAFVAAAKHEGGLIPGVLCPDSEHALIPWGCEALVKNEYFVLSNPGGLDLVWESACEGKVPLGALRGGKTIDDEDLYIGRINVDSTFISGKVHPSHKTCYIAHEGTEKGFEKYEVLCVKSLPCPVKEKCSC